MNKMSRFVFVWLAGGAILLTGAAAPDAASAAVVSFHFMQIEQVIGGVNGDPSVQAIQLRMRRGFQEQMQQSRLVVYDMDGSNPIDLILFPKPVPNEGEGVRILVVSSNFADFTDPPVVADFVLTNLIPPSYLPAGSLTFEDNFGTVFWRLSWGGSDYTGPTTGDFTNDSDGDFGPPFGDPLPSSTLQAVRFLGPADAKSTRNVDDYALTDDAAVFTNNAGRSFTVTAPCDACDANCDGSVDLTDVEPFIRLLLGGDPCDACTGDTTGDGSVDLTDVEGFIECLLG